MSVQLAGDIAKALLPAATKFCGVGYESVAKNYQEIFEVRKTDMAFVDLQLLAGFGSPSFISDGGSIAYDKISQAYSKQIRPEMIGLGYIVSHQAILNNKAPEVVAFRSRDIGRAMAEAENRLAWNVVNNAFSAGAFVGPDGVAMMSSVHPLARGGTASNVLATAADLSELAIETLLTQISRCKDDSGKFAVISADKLAIPPELMFEAKRILGSDKQNDSANNALNALKAFGYLQSMPVVSPFLTDANNWFIHTNAPDGLLHIDRLGLTTSNDTEFNSDNARYKVKQMYVNSFMNWRAMYGSNPT